MKAIKDCEWEVEILTPLWWIARAFVGKAGMGFHITSHKRYATQRSAKRNWEQFAKLNKIKKWKYV